MLWPHQRTRTELLSLVTSLPLPHSWKRCWTKACCTLMAEPHYRRSPIFPMLRSKSAASITWSGELILQFQVFFAILFTISGGVCNFRWLLPPHHICTHHHSITITMASTVSSTTRRGDGTVTRQYVQLRGCITFTLCISNTVRMKLQHYAF